VARGPAVVLQLDRQRALIALLARLIATLEKLMTRLTDKVRMLFDGRYFAVLSTLEPDGRPHSTVTWVKRVADDPLVALPRAPSSRALPPSRTTRTAGLVDELSHKYTGGPYPGFAGVRHPQWVVARITADKVTTSWPDS
jgi:hypothetical protein